MHVLFALKFKKVHRSDSCYDERKYYCQTSDHPSHVTTGCTAAGSCLGTADSDHELSFINCSRSVMDASIPFLRLLFVQSNTCMQMILFTELKFRLSSASLLAQQQYFNLTNNRYASQPVFALMTKTGWDDIFSPSRIQWWLRCGTGLLQNNFPLHQVIVIATFTPIPL